MRILFAAGAGAGGGRTGRRGYSRDPGRVPHPVSDRIQAVQATVEPTPDKVIAAIVNAIGLNILPSDVLLLACQMNLNAKIPQYGARRLDSTICCQKCWQPA